LNTSIIKRFPGHDSFKGTITEYHPTSDNYSVSYQDGDAEVMSHSNVLEFVPGTHQYEAYQQNQIALYSAFHTALTSNTAPSASHCAEYTGNPFSGRDM